MNQNVVKPATHGEAVQVQPEEKFAVEEFLYRQAELLDGKQWQAYIDLFADDGVYWMPAHPEDTNWDGVPSIFVEDRNLMTVRMKRILHPDAWSQRALWYTSHVLGGVRILERSSAGELVVQSRFHAMEQRRDTARHFAGRYEHHLVPMNGDYRIRLQRVDLVNGEATFGYVLQAWL